MKLQQFRDVRENGWAATAQVAPGKSNVFFFAGYRKHRKFGENRACLNLLHRREMHIYSFRSRGMYTGSRLQ